MDSEASHTLAQWPNSMELIATDSSRPHSIYILRPVDVTAAVLCTTKD